MTCRAEALDNHLTVVQRDLEVRSQIEERKIRIEAAYEDAKRREAEEKLRQERAKAEAEVFLFFLFKIITDFLVNFMLWCIQSYPDLLRL